MKVKVDGDTGGSLLSWSSATVTVAVKSAEGRGSQRADKRDKCEEIFLPFKDLCKRRNVETLVLEGNKPATVLLKYEAEGSSVPSIILKHAPDCSDVYVVSSNKLMTNSLNPLLAAEGDLRIINKQQSSASSVSEESVFHNRSSSLASRHLTSPEFVHRNSSNYVTPQQRTNRNMEDVTTGREAVKGCHSSTYSERSDIQDEVERLRLELQDTLVMYNQACEDLTHARNKVQLFSSQYLDESGKVNAAKKREANLRKIAAEEKEKHMEAEKEAEIARKLLSNEVYKRQIAELKALQQSLEKKKIVDALLSSDGRCRFLASYITHTLCYCSEPVLKKAALFMSMWRMETLKITLWNGTANRFPGFLDSGYFLKWHVLLHSCTTQSLSLLFIEI
ncbi:hypothetical protein K7X08_015462 [Anisodus acutangulus]|uniref:RING-type E3 ubiquitin transferase n=1 Tax=Anisodus acutangulus TaxID=402998 RepID=A0A9Q1L5M7_9SOLA|nr:hypothetical protein K7X08_015462 [Anisodus acutangulus]